MYTMHSLQEHCLMGIKGTVRRSTDGDFIHANVDIDLIITEEPEMGNVEKPVEIFHIIEHFCLGRRRLHLFGRDSTIRPGEMDTHFPWKMKMITACCMFACSFLVSSVALLVSQHPCCCFFMFSSLPRLADSGSHSDKQ